MSRRGVVVAIAIAALAGWAWRAELFTVSKPGERPRPLALADAAPRERAGFDAVLPVVPAGMRRIAPGGRVLLVHYWAPWERNGRPQAVALDSLRREPGLESLDVVMVCFDPFPSVARFVGRHRLRLSVVLDGQRALEHQLDCPSVPYTYVLDRDGRIAIAQSGEVDWLSAGTRAALTRLLDEPAGASETPTL